MLTFKLFRQAVCCFALTITGLWLTPARAGLLVNDSFDDGTRTAGTNPLAVSWYSMNGPGSDLAILNDNVTGGINAGKALQMTPTAASEGIVAQFPASVTLMDGQNLSLSFQWRFTGTTNVNQAGLLRFGLLDSRGTPTAPPVGTGDNDAYERVDDLGYYAVTNPGLASPTGTTLYKWGTAPTPNTPTHSATMTYGPTLTGSSALATTAAGASINAGTTAHRTTMTIARSGKSLNFTVTIDGQKTATGTETNPLIYVFDSIAIATGAGSVPSAFIIDSVQVECSTAKSQSYPGLGVFVNSGKAGFDDAWTTNYNSFLSALGVKTTSYTPNFCDGSPLHGANGSMTSSAQYEAGTQWGNAAAQKLTPIASIPLANPSSKGNQSGTETDFKDITAGKYDGDYTLVLDAYTAGKWPMIYLRIGWEQNDIGSQYPWYATNDTTVAAAYVTAWKHVANLAHAYATKNHVTIKTVWCPAVCNYANVDPTNTYPIDAGSAPGGSGDQYVDVMGMDVYTPVYLSQEGDHQYYSYATNTNVPDATTWATTGPGAAVNRGHWLDFPGATYYGQYSTGGSSLAYAIVMAQQHLKPLCVPETGSNNNGNDNGPVDDPVLPLYLSDRLSQAVAQGTKLEFVCPWNGAGNFIFTDGTRPKQLASWKQFIKNMAALGH